MRSKYAINSQQSTDKEFQQWIACTAPFLPESDKLHDDSGTALQSEVVNMKTADSNDHNYMYITRTFHKSC